MHIRYRADIDGLRAIAVGSVVLFHAGFGAFSGGFVGVDIFFVISGYLIGRALFDDADAGRLSIASFYERRCRRILPALLVVMAFTLIAGLFILLPSELISFAKSMVASTAFAANFYFFKNQNYFGGVPLSKPLLHMWSLAVEEQYYLVWPLFVLILYRFGMRRWRTPLIAIAIVVSLAAAELMLGYSSKTSFYMLPMRAWELLAGAILATGDVPPVRRRAHAEWLSALALALIVAPVFLYTETIRFPGLSAVPPVLGAAILIHVGASAQSGTHRLLALRPFVRLGLISYSLYLWHWPILSLHFLATQHDATLPGALLLVALSLAAAWASWRFVERPFRRSATVSRTSRTVLAVSALALTTTAAVAFGLVLLGGLPGRLPPAARIVDAQVRDNSRIDLGCVFQEDIRPDVVKRCFDRVRLDPRPKIVLWGDSFARHHINTLSPRIRAAGAVPVSFIATGCLPTPGVVATFGRGRFDQRCADFSDRVERELRTMPKLRALIIAGRWSTLAGLHVPGQGYNPSGRFLMDRGTDIRTLETSVSALSRSLDRVAVAMDRRGVPTTFVTEPPRYPQAVRTCVARALWTRLPTDLCGSSLLEQRRFRQPIAHIFDAALGSSSLVAIYDPLPLLCSPRCRPFGDDRLLTYDEGHLTDFGSQVALRDFTLPTTYPAEAERAAPEKPRR